MRRWAADDGRDLGLVGGGEQLALELVVAHELREEGRRLPVFHRMALAEDLGQLVDVVARLVLLKERDCPLHPLAVRCREIDPG